MRKTLPRVMKQRMLAMLHEGSSLNEIAHELSLAKSTIYYWYRKVLGKKRKPLNLQVSYTDHAGEVMGIFAGDGSQYYYRRNGNYQVTVHFGAGNREYAEYVATAFSAYFGKSFVVRWHNRKTLRIRVFSQEVYCHFKEFLDYDSRRKHCTVKVRMSDPPQPFCIGFLRGFFDTDGCLSFDKRNRRLRAMFFTTSRSLADQISTYLTDLGISNGLYVVDKSHTGHKTMHNVQVHHYAILKFLDAVAPWRMNKLSSEAIACLPRHVRSQ